MKKPEPTTPATQQRWETLAKSLARLDVARSTLTGMPALKFGGKPFGALYGNALLLKLPADMQASALALEGASLAEPAETEGPMKDWVVIPDAHFKNWGSLAARALTAMATTDEARRKPPKRWPRIPGKGGSRY